MTREDFNNKMVDFLKNPSERKVNELFEQVTVPCWISVEDELPKIGWTMSDTVVVTDGNGGLRLAWYHQDEGWHFATGLTFEPTHWMPLPLPPHHIADVSKKVEKGGAE